MKGDFSTQRFRSTKHYTRVLKQQGRVELDSDWNEQTAISQHLLRTLIVDLLGRGGGPADRCGFGLADAAAEGLDPAVGDFVIGAGRYYVDGLLVENERALFYSAQPELPAPPKLNAGKTYLAYLDVWERHVTYLDDPDIREVALGGPDTCTRVKTTWQVRWLDAGAKVDPKDKAAIEQKIKTLQAEMDRASEQLGTEKTAKKKAALKALIAKLGDQIENLEKELADAPDEAPAAAPDCGELLQPLRDWASGTMAARLTPADDAESPCVLPPESRYRGLENHLYRIEVHASGDTADANQVPTFKWSRDNGAVATRWLGTTGNDVTVASARDFAAGDWVEFTGAADDLASTPGPLTRIARIDGDVMTVDAAPAWSKDRLNPTVRRWNQAANDQLTLTDGAIAITPGTGDQGWIAIEDGLEVQFTAGTYRSGDYWLIPARVATGAIEWPMGAQEAPLSLGPQGIEHHYAPLFMVEATGTSPFVSLVKDCRCRFAPLPCLAADDV